MYRYLFFVSCASVDDMCFSLPVYLDTHKKLIIADSLNEALAKSEWLSTNSSNEPKTLIVLELDNDQQGAPRHTIFEFSDRSEIVKDDKCDKCGYRYYDPEEFKWV